MSVVLVNVEGGGVIGYQPSLKFIMATRYINEDQKNSGHLAKSSENPLNCGPCRVDVESVQPIPFYPSYRQQQVSRAVNRPAETQ